jgi:pyruvate-formate lyase
MQTMRNQHEYHVASFTDEYMMEADYDMALMMKDDCIKQLMALRELQYIMTTDELERLRFVIRENLRGAEGDIHRYESRHGKPKGSLESTI